MHFAIANPLRFLAGRPYHTDTGVMSHASDAGEAPQTDPLDMGLKDHMNRFGGNLTTVAEGVKRLAESLLAMGATVALGAFTGFVVFMSSRMTAQRTFHWGQ